jgi:hypothetical protein
MFVGRAARIITAVTALIGVAALIGTFILTVTGGSEYVKFVLAMVLFASILTGSYWFVVFGPGRRL